MTELNQGIRNIERPDRIKRLPVSDRGFPVPSFVATIDGVPDFRAIEPGKMVRAHRLRLCWICGQPLGRYIAFVIGPMCAINRISSEPPSHRDCAEYAAKACPFLSKPGMRRNEKDLPEGSAMGGIPILHNPGVALLWVSHGYRVRRDGNGGVLFEIGEPVSTAFFREGRDATRHEVMAAINKGLPILQDLAQAEGSEAVAELQARHRKAMELVPPSS